MISTGIYFYVKWDICCWHSPSFGLFDFNIILFNLMFKLRSFFFKYIPYIKMRWSYFLELSLFIKKHLTSWVWQKRQVCRTAKEGNIRQKIKYDLSIYVINVGKKEFFQHQIFGSTKLSVFCSAIFKSKTTITNFKV